MGKQNFINLIENDKHLFDDLYDNVNEKILQEKDIISEKNVDISGYNVNDNEKE